MGHGERRAQVMEMENNSPVALVTGASKRIGRAISQALILAGYDLALHYNNSGDEATSLAKMASEIRSGARVELLKADLEKPDELACLASEAAGRFGRLDLLVNNASFFKKIPIKNMGIGEINNFHRIHVTAPAILSLEAAPYLRQAKPGHIINIIDIFADFPRSGYTPYAVSKAGLKALSRQLALELAPDILVNAISPGAISEPDGGLTATAKQAMLKRIPLGRFGDPDDIAKTVLFLCSSGYITGQNIAVDGGRTLAI